MSTSLALLAFLLPYSSMVPHGIEYPLVSKGQLSWL